MSVITGCPAPVDFLDSFDCTGTLALDDLELSTKAWSTVHLLPLWLPVGSRGSNLVLPEVFGTVPYPRRITEATHTLLMLVTGCWDFEGDPYTDPLVGLQANVTFLRNALFTPSDPAAGTKAATLTMPDTSTRTGLAQTESFVLGDPDPVQNGIYYRATLTLTLPLGVLL